MGSKILVTGAEGFIGRHFMRYSARRGYQPMGLDKKNGIGVQELITSEQVREMFADVDSVVHLAANCSSIRSIKDPLADFKDNAMGTLAVLEFARRKNIVVVYTSTCKVYSAEAVNKLNGEPVHEGISTTEGARSPYGTSKLTGELYLQEYYHLYGVPMVINRMSTIFGCDQNGTEEAGWVHWFVRAKKEGLPLTIYGAGEQVRDPLWVDDLCALLLHQVEHVETYQGGIFNVGGGPSNAVSINAVIKYLDKKGDPPLAVYHDKPRPADLNVYISDMAKLFSVTDWRPSTGVWKGIDRIFESL